MRQECSRRCGHREACANLNGALEALLTVKNGLDGRRIAKGRGGTSRNAVPFGAFILSVPPLLGVYLTVELVFGIAAA